MQQNGDLFNNCDTFWLKWMRLTKKLLLDLCPFRIRSLLSLFTFHIILIQKVYVCVVQHVLCTNIDKQISIENKMVGNRLIGKLIYVNIIGVRYFFIAWVSKQKEYEKNFK